MAQTEAERVKELLNADSIEPGPRTFVRPDTADLSPLSATERDQQPDKNVRLRTPGIKSQQDFERLRGIMSADGARQSMTPAQWDSRMAQLRGFTPSLLGVPPPFEGNILTDAVPTGNPSIDDAGTSRVSHTPPGARGIRPRTLTIPDLGAPDSDRALTAKAASEGVDYRRGIGFGGRFEMVANSDTPDVQKQVFEEVIGEIAAQLPDGSPMIRLNKDTGEVEYLRLITDLDVQEETEAKGSAGSFRWTATQSSGLTVEAFAELFDAAEIGSIIGGVTGAVATRNLTFFKQAGAVGDLAKAGGFGLKKGSQGLAGEAGLGLAGREIGQLLRLSVSMAQGRDINWQQELSQATSNITKEAIIAMGGRAATKALEKMKSGIVRGRAKLQGLRVVEGTAEGAAARQAAAKQTSEDTAALNERLAGLGREERITVSRAESESNVNKQGRLSALAEADDIVNKKGTLQNASGQQKRINQEHAQRVNAGQTNRQLTIDRDAENITGLRVIAEDTVGKQPKRGFDPEDANRIVRDAEAIHISAVEGSPHRGRIHPGGVENTADGARAGIIFEVKNDSVDIVSSGLPEGQQRIGLGTDMYREFIAFAKAEGKDANSGSVLTLDADQMWRKLADEGHAVVKADAADFVPQRAIDGTLEGFTHRTPGKPLYSIKAPVPLITSVVETAKRAGSLSGSKAARDRAQSEWDRLLYNPTSRELGMIKNEATQNYARRVDMLEEIFNEYHRVVNKGNKYQGQAVANQWYTDAERMLEAVLTPQEFARVRGGSPATFRKVFNELAESRNDLMTGLGGILKIGNTNIFKNNTDILRVLRSVDKEPRRRALRLLQDTSPSMYGALQAEVRQEIGDRMFKSVAGATVTRPKQAAFGKWLTQNTKMLNDLFPDDAFLRSPGNSEYVENLHRFNRALARDASRQGAKAPKLVVNTPLLQMTRTVMGVMNKWQRRITAGRRIQMAKWYGRIVEVVSEPAKLKELVAITELQPRLGESGTAVVAAAIRLGIVDNEEEYSEFERAARQWMTWFGPEDRVE